MSRWILASNNAHKVEEIGRVLGPQGIRLHPLSDFPEIPEPPETGATFEDNALQKARFVFERTGLPCIADDSGLEVDALGGAPGVHSKRFTPQATAEANNAHLLERLEGVSARGARFVCALAVVSSTVEEVWRGTCEGSIGLEARGGNGFGYDPLFLPEQAPGKTMAELPPAEKDRIGHRGRALERLPAVLEKLQQG
ncbi:MAG: RdgB/HAM1 family non-canonical purine NTP pyrophosphatase [Myxococcota bacterium]|nr:RdgB/HAM1 family non-canonical purine NTP pyrophosphatase [Myxococcota bacterium]